MKMDYIFEIIRIRYIFEIIRIIYIKTNIQFQIFYLKKFVQII